MGEDLGGGLSRGKGLIQVKPYQRCDFVPPLGPGRVFIATPQIFLPGNHNGIIQTFPSGGDLSPSTVKRQIRDSLGCALAAGVQQLFTARAASCGADWHSGGGGITFVLMKRPAVRGPMAGSSGHRGASAGPAAMMIVQKKLVNYSDWFLSSPFRTLISLRILK